MLWMWEAWSPGSSRTVASSSRSPRTSTTRFSTSVVTDPLTSRTGQRMLPSSSINRPGRSKSYEYQESAIRCGAARSQ
jgi:hypothetical protein